MQLIEKLTGFTNEAEVGASTPQSGTRKQRGSVLNKAGSFSRSHTQKKSELKVLLKFESATCSKRSGLNQTVAEQIYQECPKDAQGRIFIQDFLLVCFEARKILKERHEELLIKQIALKNEQKQINELLKQNVRDQQQNKYSIDKYSVLKLQVVEAHNLLSSTINIHKTALPFVSLNCGGRTLRTAPPYIKDRVNPKWNQAFEFPVTVGNEELHLEVRIAEDNGGPENTAPTRLLGQVVIPVNGLRDQLISDSLHPIYDSHSLPTQAQIHLILHWVYNKVGFFEHAQAKNLIENTDIQIDLKDIENDMEEIKFYLNEESIKLPPKSQVTRIQPTEKFETNTVMPDPLHRTILLSAVLLFCSMIESVGRTPFLDVMIGLITWIFIFVDYFSKTNMIRLLAGIGVSFLYDIFWISIFYPTWSSYAGTLDLYSGSGSDGSFFQEITIILVVIGLFLKVWLAIEVIWMCSNLFTEQYENNKLYYIFSIGKYQFVIREVSLRSPQLANHSHSGTPRSPAGEDVYSRDRIALNTTPADNTPNNRSQIPTEQNVEQSSDPERLERIKTFNPNSFNDPSTPLHIQQNQEHPSQ